MRDVSSDHPLDPARREFLERGAALGLGYAALNSRAA